VILNLAIVVGAAVIFPAGLSGSVNWFAALLTAVSFVALYRFKIDVLLVIVASGLIGLVKILVL
jgi:chromate transporter